MDNKLIICDKKIKELNELCYPEDRKPYKSIKDIKDLSFRDKIKPEKYIKSRQKRREMYKETYTYNDMHDFLTRNNSKYESEDYADTYIEYFKKLERKLLSIGGYEVVFTDDCTLEELKKILVRGQFLDGRRFSKTHGDAGKCHRNSTLGWSVNRDKAIIMSGYALSDDGYWFAHSWLINVKANSQPLETTPIKRCAYFGYALNLNECEEFLSYF